MYVCIYTHKLDLYVLTLCVLVPQVNELMDEEANFTNKYDNGL